MGRVLTRAYMCGRLQSAEWFFRMFAKDTLGDELADTVLRITDLCGMLGIDLETRIRAKMRYNLSRPHKHGKAY